MTEAVALEDEALAVVVMFEFDRLHGAVFHAVTVDAAAEELDPR